MSDRPTSGRRIAMAPAGRLGPLLLTGLVAALVAVVAVVLQAPAREQPEVADTAPRSLPLSVQSMGCPAAAPGGGPLVVGTDPGPVEVGDGGRLRRRTPGEPGRDRVRLRPGGVSELRVRGAAVLEGDDDLAPGLFGARVASGPRPAVGECTTPVAERWYAGVGAGGSHASRVQLINPDPGPAVAEVEAWSTDGPLERVQSSGLTVPGRGSSELDLAQLAPHRDELVLRVAVERGRVAVSVADSYAVGTGPAARDWLPTTAGPAREVFLPGLPRRAQEHTLTLLNPGDSEGRVTLRVAGRASTFRPADTPDIRVPPGTVVVTDLTSALGRQLQGEDASLVLSSTVPVVAGLRSRVSGDLVHLAGTRPEAVDGPRAAALPTRGDSVLVLAGAETASRVAVRFPGSDRKPARLRLRPDVSTAVDVPGAARAVVVEGSGPFTAAVRTVTSGGAAVTPLRPLVVSELVPAVRPALRTSDRP